MATFESFVQALPGVTMPPTMMTGHAEWPGVQPIVDAPVVVDATSARGVQPLVKFLQSLQANTNVAVAAAEGRRLAPYFNMMSAYLGGVIDRSERLDSEELRQEAREITTPENLARVFNATAAATKNTLTSDVAVLPANILREGPAAGYFKTKEQFFGSYRHNKNLFYFGFHQVYEQGVAHNKSSTTIPIFLLDDKMIDAAMPYGIAGALRSFQAVMTHVNHDMLHHFTSPLLHEYVAFKFPKLPDFREKGLGKWEEALDKGAPNEDAQSQYYEAWSKIGHANALVSPRDPGPQAEAGHKIERFFKDLERIGADIAAEGDPGARARAHEVVDYFSTVMAHALSRVYPFDHPLMEQCLGAMCAADPMPERVAYECAGNLVPNMDRAGPDDVLAAIRRAVKADPELKEVSDGYARQGIDIMAAAAGFPGYGGAKLVQLAKMAFDDVSPQVPMPAVRHYEALQKDAGALTLQMFEAVAETFLPRPARVSFKSLARADFKKAGASQKKTIYAVSSVEAETGEIPGTFALVPLNDVLELLAEPGFAKDRAATLVTPELRAVFDETVKTDPDYRQAFEILTGRSDSGIGLHMVAAAVSQSGAAKSGKTGSGATMLCVLEDYRRQKCLVLGDAAVAPEQVARLGKAGLTYVTRSDPQAAAAIDRFLQETAQLHYANGRGLPEAVIQAYASVCEIPRQFHDGSYSIPKGIRPGAVLAAPTTAPSAYTSLVQFVR